MGNYGQRFIQGESGRFDQTGTSVSGIGDFNGDGIEDFAITAPYATSPGGGVDEYTYGGFADNGAVFVVYGTEDADLSFSLDDIDGTNGFKIDIDPALGDYDFATRFGTRVVGLGDVNGDGTDDFGIVQNGTDQGYYGYYFNATPTNGVAYVIYGGEVGTAARLAVDDLDHMRLDTSGEIVDLAALGDVNGDGFNEIGVVTKASDGGTYIQVDRLYDYNDNGVYDTGYDPDTGTYFRDYLNSYQRYVGLNQVNGYVVYGTDQVRTDNSPVADAGGSTVIIDLESMTTDQGESLNLGQTLTGGGFYGGGEIGVSSFASASIDIGSDIYTGLYADTTFGLVGVDIDGDGFNDVLAVESRVYANDIYAVYDRGYDGNYDFSYTGGVFAYGYDSRVFSGTSDGLGTETVLSPAPFSINEVAALGNFHRDDTIDELALVSFVFDGDFPELTEFTQGVFVINGTSTFLESSFVSFGAEEVIAGEGAFFYSADTVTEIVGVLGIGDVNPPAEGSGDAGLDDMFILARVFDDVDFSSSYRGYIVFGTQGDRTGLIELEQLVADGGAYRINIDPNAIDGFDPITIASAGDVNNDGAADILVGQRADNSAVVIHGGAALEAADAADGTDDNVIASSSFRVDVETGLLPIDLELQDQRIVRSEGDAGPTAFDFTVTRTGDLTAEVSFDWTVTGVGQFTFRDVADGADFEGGVLPGGTITFASGSDTATISVPVQGDLLDENSEDFRVQISNGTSDNGAPVAIVNDTVFGTIANDDDPAFLSVNNASVFEGDPGDDRVLVFSIFRSGDTDSEVTVDWLAQPLSAEGDDFEGGLNQSGFVTFAPGITVQTVELPIAEDDLSGEGNEFITFTLSNPVSDSAKGVLITRAGASGQIIEDDIQPNFSVNNVFVTETDDTNVLVTFTVVRSQDTSGTSTIDFALENDTTETSDFASGFLDPVTGAPRVGTLTFAPGVTEQTITLEVAPDNEVEGNEQMVVRFSNPTNDSGSGIPTFQAAARLFITDDDRNIEFRINDAFVTEGDPDNDQTMTFNVIRSGSLEGEATVDFAIAEGLSGTLADATDFVSGFPASGTLTFADGVDNQTIQVVVRGDNDFEPTEVFSVSLSNAVPPTGETAVITRTTALGQIFNDDLPVTFSVSNQSVAEGDTGDTTQMTFTVFRTGNVDVAATVDYTVEPVATGLSASDDDIVGTFPQTGTLSFAAGTNSQTITVDIQGDGTVEPNETFQVVLDNADAGGVATLIASPIGFGTILNDDVATDHAVLFFDPLSAVEEGAGGDLTEMSFRIFRSGDVDVASSVDYQLTASPFAATSAEAPDFEGGLPQSGTVNFAPGQLQQVVTFLVRDDEVQEVQEQVSFTISNAQAPDNGAGATISNATTTGNIIDDERPVFYSVRSASTTEGEPGETSELTFTLLRSGDISVAGTVDYTIGTYIFSPATSDDLTVQLPITGTASFVAGQIEAEVTVEVAGDNVVEGTEYLQIDLSNPTAEDTGIDPQITTSRAYGYILDDDQPSFVRVSGSSVSEGDGAGAASQLFFTIQRYGDVSAGLEVDYDISGGTVDANDFSSSWPTSGTITFGPNDISRQVILNVQGDEVIEANEFTYFTITDARSADPTIEARVTTSVASATILNDDFPAQISVNSWSAAAEGDTPADNTFLTFTVSRSGDTSSAVEVDYSFTGSGFDPIDFDDLQGGMPQSGIVQFAAGDTIKTISFAIAEDMDVEANEQGTLRLFNERVISGAPDASVQLVRNSATGIINNDDQPPSIRVEVNGSRWGTFVTEGNGGLTPVTFSIIREGDLSGRLEVDYVIFSDTSSFQGASDLDFLGTPIGDGRQTVSFADGASTQLVTVLVQGDTIIEANEVFGLQVLNYSSSTDVDYTVQNPRTLVTIGNDDGRPAIPELPFDVDGDGVIEPGETIRVEADVFGDPHIVTLDGLGYNFQAVGEYVLVETVPGATNPFSVQVRFEPFPGSDLVSVTTKMAVSVKGKVIEVDALGANLLTVDGVAIDLEEAARQGVDLDDDADNAQDIFVDEDGKIFIRLNDAGELLMIGKLDGALNVCVFLGDPALGGNAGAVRGLMGNANQDLTDDFQLRDGSEIPAGEISFDDDGTPSLTFDFVYGFGEFDPAEGGSGGYRASWAITAQERLFSDTAPDFPDNFPAGPVDFDSLPPNVQAAARAQALAAGLDPDDPFVFDAAVLDFALTGNEDFLEGATQLAADPEAASATTENPDTAPSVGVAADLVSITEGDSGSTEVIFTFYRAGDTNSPLTVDYEILGDVDAVDLAAGTPLTGTVSFDEGEVTQTLGVTVNGDLATELDEDLIVRITGTDNSAVLISGSQGTTTILTDDFAPEAQDDLVAGLDDAPISGNVFGENGQGEDTDADDDTLILTRVIVGDSIFEVGDSPIDLGDTGILEVESDGTFRFTPGSDFAGLSTSDVATFDFDYEVSDGNGGTDIATATVLVEGSGAVNTPPDARDDAFAVDLGAPDPVTGVVLSGNIFDDNGNGADTDADGTGFTLVSAEDSSGQGIRVDGFTVQLASGAFIRLDADGSFEYDATGGLFGRPPISLFEALAAGEVATESFTYTISDGTDTDTATVTITVTGTDDDPIARLNFYDVDENATVFGNLIDDDTGTGVDEDPEGGPLTLVGFNNTPLADLVDVDPDTDGIQVAIGGGLITIAADGSFSYEARDFEDLGGASGGGLQTRLATFTYEIADEGGNTDSALFQIRVNGVNDAPVAEDDTAETPFETALENIDVLGNDTDPEDDPLSVTDASVLPEEGTVVVNDDDTLTFTPADGFSGTATITYLVSDGALETEATLSVVVGLDPNRPPLFGEDPITLSVDENQTAAGAVTATDPDGDTLTYRIIGGADADLLDIDSLTGALTFLEAPDFEAPQDDLGDNSYSVEVEVSDGTFTDTVGVEITVGNVNEGFTAVVDSFEISEDATEFALGNVLLNDADPEGDAQIVGFLDAAGNQLLIGAYNDLADGGRVLLEEDGDLFFDPADDFEARGFNPQPEPPAIVFSYVLSDGEFEDIGQISVDVTGVNDAPGFTSPTAFSIEENTSAVGTLTAEDVEGDALTFAIVGGLADDGALFEVDADSGELRFLDAPDFEARGDADGDNVYELTVEVSDGDLSTTQTLTVAVEDVDERPSLNLIEGTNDLDRLVGTDGADRIDLKGGRLDFATGNGGADVFDFRSSVENGIRERKIITDFEVGVDSMDLGGASVLATLESRGSTILQLDGDFDQIVLAGVVNFPVDGFDFA